MPYKNDCFKCGAPFLPEMPAFIHPRGCSVTSTAVIRRLFLAIFLIVAAQISPMLFSGFDLAANCLAAVGSDGSAGRPATSGVIDAPPDPFGDVPASHWAREDVDELRKMGFTIGFPDGFFKGDAGLSRFEFAALLNRLMKADRANSVVLMKRDDFAALMDLLRKTIEVADRARAEADLANRRLDERFGPDLRSRSARIADAARARRSRTRPSLWRDEPAGHGRRVRGEERGQAPEAPAEARESTEERRPKMRWLKDHDFR